MGTRELTEAESEFADLLRVTILGMGNIQSAARNVAASGGDCRAVFLSLFDDDTARAEAAMQWPFIQMMLGV